MKIKKLIEPEDIDSGDASGDDSEQLEEPQLTPFETARDEKMLPSFDEFQDREYDDWFDRND